MLVLITLAIIFALLVINEVWWRKRDVHGEMSRKFIHLTVGSYAAFWPFYLSWTEIKLLGLAFLVVVAISKYLNVFESIHSVQRVTWGEFCFAISVFLIAFVTHNKWIYAASLLQMALADGLAAIIGVRFGKRVSYVIFGHTKSLIGTLTFFVVSLAVLVVINHIGMLHVHTAWLILASALACILENIAVIGLDNLFVPLVVALLLVHH